MTDPTTPSVEPTNAAAAAPAASGTGLTPNLAAALAALFSIVGGIVFLVLEKNDKYVRFHSMQAVFLGGAGILVSLGANVVSFVLAFIPLIGWIFSLLIWLASLALTLVWLVAWVVSVYKAFIGEEWEIPKLGALARKQLAQTDARPTPPVM